MGRGAAGALQEGDSVGPDLAVAHTMNVGFIGLGIMGFPMASHLLRAGHRLLISSRSARVPAMMPLGATTCETLRELAQHCEFVFLMLPNTTEVEAVLFAPVGVAEGAASNTVVIDMSSISPGATRQFARRLGEIGVAYLDAPVSGGEVGAREATLSIMVGGADAVFERALPLLKLLGKNIRHVGGSGDGQTTKVANQMIVALGIAAVGEALLFASKSGADPHKVREALLGGFASSRVLEVHGKRMLERAFTPGFRARLHRKDLELGLTAARDLGLPVPLTALCHQLFNALEAFDGGELDHSALLCALENLAAYKLGQYQEKKCA